MGTSHNDDPSPIPLFDDPGDLQRLTMIRRKSGRNPKYIGLRILNPRADLIPAHAKMVIAGIELERASVIKGIKILKI